MTTIGCLVVNVASFVNLPISTELEFASARFSTRGVLPAEPPKSSRVRLVCLFD